MSPATQFDVNAVVQSLENEGAIPDLSDLAQEPSQGAWPTAWYPAVVLDGYATRKGTQFLTIDIVSNAGDSRNLRLCFAVTNKAGETRNVQAQLNYRKDDFTAERIKGIKVAREAFKGKPGKWGVTGSPEADVQRSSLAVAKLGQLQKAFGCTFANTDVGIDPSPFVGAQVDVRLGTDSRGFNEITEFAPAGTKTGKK